MTTTGDLFLKYFTSFIPKAKVHGLKVSVPLSCVTYSSFGVNYKLVVVRFANGVELENKEVKKEVLYQVTIRSGNDVEINLNMSERLFFSIEDGNLIISLV